MAEIAEPYGATDWLRHVADGCYIVEEGGAHVVKKLSGVNAIPDNLPKLIFEYFLREGLITPDGPEGEPHDSFFLTDKGKAISEK